MRYFRKIYWAFFYSLSLSMLIDFILRSLGGFYHYSFASKVVSPSVGLLITVLLRPFLLAFIFTPIFILIRKVFKQVKIKLILLYFFFIPFILNNIIVYKNHSFDITIFIYSFISNCLSLYFFIVLFRDMPRPLTVVSFKKWFFRSTSTLS